MLIHRFSNSRLRWLGHLPSLSMTSFASHLFGNCTAGIEYQIKHKAVPPHIGFTWDISLICAGDPCGVKKPVFNRTFHSFHRSDAIPTKRLGELVATKHIAERDAT